MIAEIEIALRIISKKLSENGEYIQELISAKNTAKQQLREMCEQLRELRSHIDAVQSGVLLAELDSRKSEVAELRKQCSEWHDVIREIELCQTANSASAAHRLTQALAIANEMIEKQKGAI